MWSTKEKTMKKYLSMFAIIATIAMPLSAHPGHQSHRTDTGTINHTQVAPQGTSWCRSGDTGYCHDWAVQDHANSVDELYQGNGATISRSGSTINVTGFNGPVTFVSFMQGRIGGMKRSNLSGGNGQMFAPRGTLTVSGRWLYIDCTTGTVPGVRLVGLEVDCSQPDDHGNPVGALMATDFVNPSWRSGR
jgi:hypothetical protein